MFAKDELVAAHRYCTNNRGQLDASSEAGCFFCKSMFASGDVTDWCDEGQTALCPRCGIDSVLGSHTGLPIADPAFLEAMHQYWFNTGLKGNSDVTA
jgi:hypothetical protein